MAQRPDDALWTTIETWLDEGWNREATGSYEDLKLLPLQRCLSNLAAVNQLPRPITVAGTKGKGSTARLIEAILVAHQVPTVTFSSPHVLHISERWRLDGEPVPGAIMLGALQRSQAAIPADMHLTYFERCFLLAVALSPGRTFICEVGLGGRLDCANALNTGIAVLTHLSLDHVHILGDTVEKIAREKIAIARPDADIFVGQQSHISHETLQELAPQHRHFHTPTPFDQPMALVGDHQQANAGLAQAVAERALGRHFDAATAQQALQQATLLGRSHVVQHDGQSIFLDGAHNDASLATAIATAAANGFDDARILLGLAHDKDAEAIASVLPLQRVERVGYEGERSRGQADWPATYANTPWHASIAAALTPRKNGDQPQQAVIVCGSFYLVGEALKALGLAKGS